MAKILTFGELMIRLAPAGFLRFSQVFPGDIETTFAGAEANVAVSLALFGADAAYMTVLPKHDIADAAVATLRRYGVDTSRIIRSDSGRLGIYFVETGANQRASQVIYDREGAAIALYPESEYDWNQAFEGVTWFHTTGITPALSAQTPGATLGALKAAKAKGATVSMDLNFRKKLWRWEPGTDPRTLASQYMRQLLPYVDLLIANESDCADILDIHADNTDTEHGKLDVARYPQVARKVCAMFPNIQKVAITLRESFSATHNNWGAMLYDQKEDKPYFAPVDSEGTYTPYEIRAIVDRVGGGDSFAAGLIYALNSEKYNSTASAIQFAAAASCLAHSIRGDFNLVKLSEVDALMKGNASGRVQR